MNVTLQGREIGTEKHRQIGRFGQTVSINERRRPHTRRDPPPQFEQSVEAVASVEAARSLVRSFVRSSDDERTKAQ